MICYTEQKLEKNNYPFKDVIPFCLRPCKTVAESMLADLSPCFTWTERNCLFVNHFGLQLEDLLSDHSLLVGINHQIVLLTKTAHAAWSGSAKSYYAL